MSILLKTLYFLIFSLLVIYIYYFGYRFHVENFSGRYSFYLLGVVIFYFIYFFWNYFIGKKSVFFSPLKIFLLFLLHFFWLCILFFKLNGINDLNFGFYMFFSVFFNIIIPVIILFLCYNFGKFLLEFIKGFEKEHDYFKFLVSIGLGMVIFITILSILGFFGFYNIYAVLGILTIFSIFSYKQILESLNGIIKYKFEFQNHDFESPTFLKKINFNLLSAEFLFIISTLLIGVNLISIDRPMPIGWDDMGVYMNYPQLFANAGEILNLGGMFSWQVFTGIGYMLQNPTLAFLLNNVGGILSFILIVLSFSYFLNSKKDSFLNLPLFAGTIFLAMPMIIFQQAKDMKLDPGLFFFSSLSVFMVLYIFLKYIGYKKTITKDIGSLHYDLDIENSKDSQIVKINEEKYGKNTFLKKFLSYTYLGKDIFLEKKYYIYIFLIGIFAGFAFSVKFTSLLLISAIIGVFFYSKLGVSGFFGYITLYVAIFTKLGLWSLMNVIYPKDDINFINSIFLGLSITSIIFFIYSIKKYGLQAFNKLLYILGIFLFGTLLILSPWIIKNYISLNGEKITISSLINGKGDRFVVDYKKIYSDTELEEINKSQNIGLSTSGTTTNEDFGRYFGYEKGINNYLKLPYNLTMQVNQQGEYTDITYLYLALVPVLIIFLSYKNIIFFIPSLFISVFLVLFLFSKDIIFLNGLNKSFTLFLEQFNLPGGYFIIALFFVIPFLYFMYSLKKDKNSQLFRLNAVFLVFYVFLWSIRAFGIVWYGITMYYGFLLVITLSASYFVFFDDKKDDYKSITFKFLRSIVLFFVIVFYIFSSVIPHAMANLKNSGFITFKNGQTDKYQTIFLSQPYYFNVLKTLNLKDEKILFNDVISKINKDSVLKKIIENNKITDLNGLKALFTELINISDPKQKQDLYLAINEANNLSSYMYKNILYPIKENKNEAGIYRIGTFLKYFIADNYKRLFEDSLIFEFDKYFYDEKNKDLRVERMQKIGVNYFLVDLNAATIDRDPRRDLTRRYETLLHTFTSDKLKLVETDSLCLKMALELYQKSLIDLNEFKLLGGVNYESYNENGELTYHRKQKQLICYNKMLFLIQENEVSQDSFTYLLPIKNYIKNYLSKNEGKKTKQEIEQGLLDFFGNNVSHGWFALFEIKK